MPWLTEGLTHGAPVDGLGLVFVLGSVPHERQPFYSCQSAARRQTDRQGGRQTGRESDRTSPKGGVEEKKQKKKKGGQNRGMWLTFFTKRARAERVLSPWTLDWTADNNAIDRTTIILSQSLRLCRKCLQ